MEYKCLDSTLVMIETFVGDIGWLAGSTAQIYFLFVPVSHKQLLVRMERVLVTLP